VSVVVFGRYHELPDTPEYKDMRYDAWSALQRRPVWWEPAYVITVLGAEERPLSPLFFDINIERINWPPGFGGVIDVFVDRCFRHNFDPSNADDAFLVRRIAFLNEVLLDAG
jgi:hypothetical protein